MRHTQWLQGWHGHFWFCLVSVCDFVIDYEEYCFSYPLHLTMSGIAPCQMPDMVHYVWCLKSPLEQFKSKQLPAFLYQTADLRLAPADTEPSSATGLSSLRP